MKMSEAVQDVLARLAGDVSLRQAVVSDPGGVLCSLGFEVTEVPGDAMLPSQSAVSKALDKVGACAEATAAEIFFKPK